MIIVINKEVSGWIRKKVKIFERYDNCLSIWTLVVCRGLVEGDGGDKSENIMNIHEQIQLWNQVMIRVLDVRIKRIGRGDEIYHYLTPTSAFLFVAQGQGELWVDDDVWLSERFYLLHVGKGRRVTVRTHGFLDVYLILYKTALPAVALREFHMMLQTDNPFEESWGLVPTDPLELLELVQTMLGSWQQADEGLARLRAKGDFICFAHTILRQRADHMNSPSLSEQVIRYLTRNYRQAIVLEQLARQLNYSPQYISRKFKEQTGYSPMDYVIRLRMDGARELLLATTATLQEVASHIGYPDLMYFNRIFKKNVGMTPGQYRNRFGSIVSDCAINMINPSVVMLHPVRYHLGGNDIHSQYILDGANSMPKYTRNFSAVVLLCLTMIVTSCGSTMDRAGVETQATGSSPNIGSTEEAGVPSANETKTVSTAFGDVEVPTHPKRVAAISYLGTVLALEVKPIASERFLMNSPYLADQLDGVEDIGESLEKLLDLEPDLIITHNPTQEAVDKYKQIAPTVSVPYNNFPSIQEEMRYFGELLNKQEAAEAWIDGFEKQTGQMRELIQDTVADGETISVMQEYEGTVFLFGPKSGRGGRIMYEILGMNPPAAIPEHMLKESYYEFSLEKLTDYMGDYLILTTESTLERLQADPLWGRLAPIRDNRVFLWNENQSWYRDPIAVDRQIKDLMDWIVEVSGR
jgi:iron complex transport system substrate-binding protein